MNKNRRFSIYFTVLLSVVLLLFSAGLQTKAEPDGPSDSSEESSSSSEAPAKKYPIRFTLNGGSDLMTNVSYARALDSNGQVITEAAQYDTITVERITPKDSITVVSSVVLYEDASGNGSAQNKFADYYFSGNNTKFTFPMHDKLVIIELKTDIDPVLESSSVAESESIAASESESASIEESIENEKHNLNYGGYTILYNMSGVEAPYDTFVLAQDNTTFDKSVRAYYSTAFRVFAYYAEKNGQKGFYTLNPMDDTLTPFRVLKGSSGKQYVVSGAPGINMIPGVYKSQVLVSVADQPDGTGHVPGYIVTDSDEEQLVLLYLNGEDGKSGFYVYDKKDDSVHITPYAEYEAEKGISVEEPTEDTVPTKTPTPDNGPGFFSNYFVWFVIIGIIILIIAAALILVFIMSKRQERAEEELDAEDEEDLLSDEEEEDLLADFKKSEDEVISEIPMEEVHFDGSSYSNPEKGDENIDNEAFDASFEDAFPDEIATTVAAPVKEAPKVTPVSQVFDFTFDFKTPDVEQDLSKTNPVKTGYVDVIIPETKKAPKETLSEADFTEIHFSNKD